MIETALITGASGGIGYAFAKLFAANGCDLVLVARNKEKLEKIRTELEEKYLIHVLVFPRDLTETDAADALYKKLSVLNISVDYLVNNAGFGDYGAFVESEWNRQEQMIKLNILALTRLSYLFGGDMKKRGHGKILNVASIASYSAGPYLSVYFASKAFVLSFSEALAEELRPYGVTVTALCPGPVSTGFEAAAHLENSRMFHLIKPSNAETVAKAGFSAMKKGHVSVVAGRGMKPLVFLSHLAPRRVSCLFTKIAAKPQNKKR